MATAWERLKRGLRMELKGFLDRFTDAEQNELVVRAIREYSAYGPRLKQTTLTLDGASADVALPDDFLAVHELVNAGTVLVAEHLQMDWVAEQATDIGDYTVHGREFLRVRDATAGTRTLWYWGFHADDGSTLKAVDVERVMPLLYTLAWGELEQQVMARGGRVQAGPVSWDTGAQARVFQTRREFWEEKVAERVRNRPYGTFGAGREFNTREAVSLGTGERIP